MESGSNTPWFTRSATNTITAEGLRLKSVEDLRRSPTREDLVDPRLEEEEQTNVSEEKAISVKDVEKQQEVIYVRRKLLSCYL